MKVQPGRTSTHRREGGGQVYARRWGEEGPAPGAAGRLTGAPSEPAGEGRGPQPPSRPCAWTLDPSGPFAL